MPYSTGDRDTRPWGTWAVTDVGEKHIVKRIMVLPGKILSLQSHHHRDEHWIIVKGEAEVTVGESVTIRKENEAVFIPRETKHRIANKGDAPLEFVEVQTGETLSEEDITRYEDAYGRV